MVKLSASALPQATRAVNFIQSQLVELAKNCGNTLQDGLVSHSFFRNLEHNLEKMLHETRAACRPPPIKPVKSDFNIIKPLGRGAFGTVNLVRHKNTHQVFAMKQIKLQYEEQRDEVLLERDILSYLDSSFVVPMFCSFETKEHMYMVMEYLGGGDVAYVLEHVGSFSVDVSRLYISELVLALQHIHSYGIIHRDLKPNNLLITTTGHIKVADFGLSKWGSANVAACLTEEDCRRVAREFNDGEMCGTPLFMAPEVFLKTGYGKPVDWWATGIILYNFLYGFTPFEYGRPSALEYNVIKDDITWPLDEDYVIPEDAKNLMSLLLDKDCLTRLGTRGVDEVKGHPFFRDVDWSNLHNQQGPFVPRLENEEDTSCFPACPPLLSDECLDDGDDQDKSLAKPTDFCYVAFRFKEEYGSPLPLSDHTVKNCEPLSEESEHSEEEESEESEESESEESESEESESEESESESESEMQAIDRGYESSRSRDYNQQDSTPSPPSQHNPVQMVPEEECQSDALPQATEVLYFIQSKLIELAKNCGNTLQDGLVSHSFFMELENNLEKLLYVTRMASRLPM